MYNASSKNVFQLHAALMWTIHDFPTYANVLGWSTKGKFACPCYASEDRLSIFKKWPQIHLHGT